MQCKILIGCRMFTICEGKSSALVLISCYLVRIFHKQLSRVESLTEYKSRRGDIETLL